VLPEAVASDPERLDRFQREAKTLAALDHPSIVTIYSVEEADGIHFLTMSLIEGKTLADLIPEGGLSADRFFDFAIPLAQGLDAAHSKGITHRDLKPANVMVTEDESRLRILDFGLAKMHADLVEGNDMPTEALTQEGLVVGTIQYMSPEQAKGATIDHRTDLFSLGVLLYEMVTGQRPFQGKSSIELLSAILSEDPPAVTDSRSDLPNDLGRVIARCLEKEPAARYQTAFDLVTELENSKQNKTQSAISRAPEPGIGAGRPSIAVLPFRYREGDVDAQMMAEALAEEITSGLTRNTAIKVVGGPVTSGYGTEVDVKTLGPVLGIEYILQGGLRKSGYRIRVSAQVTEAATATQVWSESYDRDLESADIFEVQDEIRRRIVSTVSDFHGAIYDSGRKRIEGRPIDTLNAWECVYVSTLYDKIINPEIHAKARAALERAVELDPDFGLAWSYLSWIYTDEDYRGFNPRPDPMDRALEAAQKALELEPNSHIVHWLLGRVYYFLDDLDRFVASADRSLALNSDDATIVALNGMYLALAGQWKRGIQLMRDAMDLNPHFPGYYHFVLGHDAFRRGEYEEALKEYQASLSAIPTEGYPGVAATCSQLGRQAESEAAVRAILELMPDFTLVTAGRSKTGIRGEGQKRFLEGLSRAGVPEGATD
jgi:non-specific serine/threonine protein kinase